MSTDSLTTTSALTGTEPWLALPPALAIPPGAGAWRSNDRGALVTCQAQAKPCNLQNMA